MENSRPTLLWGIDEDSGKISTLPASPLLLPAILVYCILRLIAPLYRKKPLSGPLPDKFNLQEYLKNKREYSRLCAKIGAGEEFTVRECIVFNAILPKPSWAKPGEFWTY